MKIRKGKNINAELIEKLSNNKGCPLCSAIIDFEFDQFSKLQYEITHNEEIRRQIAMDGGFCDFHFRQFKKIANGKTNILLLKAIVHSEVYKQKKFSIKCRICESINEYEEKLLRTFMDYLFDNKARMNFQMSNGICFVHLNLLNKFKDFNEILEWLHKVHVEQIKKMQTDFDDMSQYKSFYEIAPEKRMLINILIEKLAGRKTGGL